MIDYLGRQGRCRTLSYNPKSFVITVCSLSGFSQAICEYCNVQCIESQHYLQDYSKKEQACESLSVNIEEIVVWA